VFSGASVPSTSPKETSSEVPAPDGRTPVEIASAPDWIINEDWALLQVSAHDVSVARSLALERLKFQLEEFCL